MDFKKLKHDIAAIFTKYDSVLIVIKGSPDPDAIASAFFLHEFASHYECKTTIFASMKVSLPQNLALITKLHIHLRFTLPQTEHYDGYIIVDFQSITVEEISNKLPCLLHIDHHALSEEKKQAEYAVLTEEVNATSTIIGGVFLESLDFFSSSQKSRLATALSYGILTDTDKLSIATQIDSNTIEKLALLSDKSILLHLEEMPYSEETLTLISKALLASVYFKDWLITGIGFVPISLRDSLAITADFLLEREEVSTVAVFGIVEGKGELFVDASFRTKDNRLDLNALIKRITPNGGGRRHKGAYQHDISYFKHTSDKAALWTAVENSTIENIKRQRENLRLNEVKSVFDNFRNKLEDLFH